jgi:hypothetical protein
MKPPLTVTILGEETRRPITSRRRLLLTGVRRRRFSRSGMKKTRPGLGPFRNCEPLSYRSFAAIPAKVS